MSLVQLTPPYEAEFEETPETVNITWKSGYEYHLVFNEILEYELSLQSKESKVSSTVKTGHTLKWQDATIIIYLIFSKFPQILNSRTESVSLSKTQLEQSAEYCIKVRSKPWHDDYSAIWSEWSPSTCWKNKAEQGIFLLFFQYKSFMVLTDNNVCTYNDVQINIKPTVCCLAWCVRSCGP